MSYTSSVSISFLPIKGKHRQSCTCDEARKRCRPAFVFSISGQVGFRQALKHLIACPNKKCNRVKKTVYQSLQKKLAWLFKEDVILGCVYLQPCLYGQNDIILTQENFNSIANHLANCPSESCARLRRSALLTIRKKLSPKISSHNSGR